jgi:putative methyltransferase (TIGR04325 family)
MSFLEPYLPNFLLDFYYERIKKSGWFGNYDNWKAASDACVGYDDDAIFQKVCAAALKVKQGEAAFERDAVLFENPHFDKNIIHILFEIANQADGKLTILDFGGSLGSTYFQYRSFLKGMDLKWCVVEQKHFVDYGKQDFENETLKFEYEVSVAIEKYQPNLILVSSVLQYLENPYDWIKVFAKSKIPYLLMDLQPVTHHKKDRITRQIVPPSIYKASYPCHLLSETNLKTALTAHYQLIQEFPAWEKPFYNCYYKGYFLKLKV